MPYDNTLKHKTDKMKNENTKNKNEKGQYSQNIKHQLHIISSNNGGDNQGTITWRVEVINKWYFSLKQNYVQLNLVAKCQVIVLGILPSYRQKLISCIFIRVNFTEKKEEEENKERKTPHKKHTSTKNVTISIRPLILFTTGKLI